MSFPFKIKDIAAATQSHEDVVARNWPLLEQALKAKCVTSIQPVVAVIATVGVECHFVPCEEHGTPSYFEHEYGHRSDYELDASGLWKWRGRGYVQLTTKANYEKYSAASGVDLRKMPAAALDPHVAAQILVAYFDNHGCFTWASRGHWLHVRELVNGGHNAVDRYLAAVWELLRVAYS